MLFIVQWHWTACLWYLKGHWLCLVVRYWKSRISESCQMNWLWIQMKGALSCDELHGLRLYSVFARLHFWWGLSSFSSWLSNVARRIHRCLYPHCQLALCCCFPLITLTHFQAKSSCIRLVILRHKVTNHGVGGDGKETSDTDEVSWVHYAPVFLVFGLRQGGKREEHDF